MFDAIAPRYDLLNHLLSAGIDKRWRAAAIRSLRLTGQETLLDVCAGTGDVALAARGEEDAGRSRERAARVVGVDFSAAMLGHGLQKVRVPTAPASRATTSGVTTSAANAAARANGKRMGGSYMNRGIDRKMPANEGSIAP